MFSTYWHILQGITAFVDDMRRRNLKDMSVGNAQFYELGLTRDSRVIPWLTVVSVLSTSNLGLNWD